MFIYIFKCLTFDISMGRKHGRALRSMSYMSGVEMVLHTLGRGTDQFFAMKVMSAPPFSEIKVSK